MLANINWVRHVDETLESNQAKQELHILKKEKSFNKSHKLFIWYPVFS